MLSIEIQNWTKKIQVLTLLNYSETGDKKRATCFATWLESDVARLPPTFEPSLGTNKVARLFFVGKRVTSLFNSFCSNAAKQVAPFFVARYTIPLEERLP